MQYSFFGKNQENEDIEEKIDKEVKEIIKTEKKKSYVKKKCGRRCSLLID